MPTKVKTARVKEEWKCCHCGKPLPKKGFVWKHRYQNWLKFGHNTGSYYCDDCVGALEVVGDPCN